MERSELKPDQCALQIVGAKTDIERIVTLFEEAKKSGMPFLPGEIEVFRIYPTKEDIEALSFLEEKK